MSDESNIGVDVSKPPAGSRVRIVVRDIGEFYGDVVPATLKSGRLPVAPWGLARTYCIAPEDIMEIEVIDPAGDFVHRTTIRQWNELDDRYARARRRGTEQSARSRKGLGQR